MFVNKLCTSVTLLTFLINYVIASDPYSIPEPKIEIFKKGFRFSIPDEEGISLFAFHGNINDPMNGAEAGQFSKDILKKCGGYWAFEDTSEKLVVGDTIHFWLFVVQNGLGYRYDTGKYVVTEISELNPLVCDNPLSKKDWIFEPEPTSKHTSMFDMRHPDRPITTMSPKKEENEEKEESSVCCEMFLDVSYRLIRLAEEKEKIIAENKVLFELAQKDEHYSKTLRIFGKHPTQYYSTARDFAQKFILNTLLLEDVRVSEARNIPDNGISFKVENLSDKIRIVMAAKKRLEGSDYELLW